MDEHAERPDLPADHAERMTRAEAALEGLSVGDSVGEMFFHIRPIRFCVRERVMPEWRRRAWTDDTAMALSIVEVLRARGRIDQDLLAGAFARRFAREPDRGYGQTAYDVLHEIGQGVSWRAAAGAVFEGKGSMGNGAAMRVGPVGAYFADDLQEAARQAMASAQVTHAHPDGQAGAVAVAVAAAAAFQTRGLPLDQAAGRLMQAALDLTPAGPTRDGIETAARLPADAPVEQAVVVLGNGTRVISSDTVPFCLWSACRNLRNYESAIWEAVAGLGDRDTTCAIVGGIVAMAVGREGIPADWIAAREPLPGSGTAK